MHLLGRRRFISAMGLGAGTWLLSPMLRTLIPPALGQPSQKKRFVLFVDSIGIHDEARPKLGTDETDFTVGYYSALEPYKKDLTIIDGMWNPFALHLHGNRWYLTATDPRQIDTNDYQPSSVSIDRAIARAIGKDTPVSSLNHLAWYDKKAGSASADGADAPYPFDYDPVAAFGKVFGMGSAGSKEEAAAQAKRLLRQRKSMLDFLTADIQRANQSLAASEKAKLEQYLTSLRDLEGRLADLNDARVSCGELSAPTPAQVGDIKEPNNPYRVKAHIDVILQALVCGFTRVAVLRHNNTGLPFLGSWTKDGGEVQYAGGHQMWHGGGDEKIHRAYYNFTADNLAHLWKGLKAAPEGEGNFADNTLVAFMNSAGGTHHNGSYSYFAMMLGSAGGHFRTGRYVKLPQSKVAENDPRRTLVATSNEQIGRAPKVGKDAPVHFVGDWYASLGEAVGAGMASFGDSRATRGPLPQLRA